MKLMLRTDSYGDETSWKITDVNNEVLYESSTYESNELYVEQFCLDSTTCYIFTILDSYGDGINAPGYYEIYYNNDLIRPAGGFVGYSENTNLPCGLNWSFRGVINVKEFNVGVDVYGAYIECL